MRTAATKWVSMATLLLAAGLWSQLLPFGVVVKFVVTAGAILVMVQALQARDYASATVFGAVTVLQNPIFPVYPFSAEWQRTLLVACAIPFAVSLTRRNAAPPHPR